MLTDPTGEAPTPRNALPALPVDQRYVGGFVVRLTGVVQAAFGTALSREGPVS